MVEVILRRHGGMVRMGMIKADHLEALPGREFLASQQFLRPDKKPVSLCFFFASVRDRVSFRANLATTLGKSTQQESAAFVGIIALAMSEDFLPLLCLKVDHSLKLSLTVAGYQCLFYIPFTPIA